MDALGTNADQLQGVLSALAPDGSDEFAEVVTHSGSCEDMEGNRCLPHVLPTSRCSRNILTHPGPAAEEVAQLIVSGMTDGLPTARSTLRNDWSCWFVWCKAYPHQGSADLRGIIDAARAIGR